LEYASAGAVDCLCKSVDLLPGHHPRDFPQGQRACRVVAAVRRARRARCRTAGRELPAIPEEDWMIRIGTASDFVGVASEAWNHPTGSSQPVRLVPARSSKARGRINMLERLNEELRRPTRVVSPLLNAASCLRLVRALYAEMP